MKTLFVVFLFFVSISYCQECKNLTLFGATGDLAKRKLVPALVNLEKRGLLPADFLFIAIGRGDEDKFWESTPQFIQKEDLVYWNALSNKMVYLMGSFKEEAIYEKLKSYPGDRLYYLAIPPAHFAPIIEKLHDHHLLDHQERVVIEKPFGTDLDSARELNRNLSEYLPEERTFRIDHYLGKPGIVQLMEHELDRTLVDSVTITLSEDIGVGTRGPFWEKTGLLRDIVQNHAMQLLSLFAMDKPKEMSAEEIQNEKVKLLRAVHLEKVARGQYEGYSREKGVDPNSHVETFAAIRLSIDNERWSGVPFTILAGKKLSEKIIEIEVELKTNQKSTFQIHSGGEYETLLLEAIEGKRSQFVSYDEIDAAWELLDPALKETAIFTYPPGSVAKKLNNY